MDFLAVKVDGSDVNPGICLYEFLGDVTSVNFNSKRVYEDEIFGRQDIWQLFSGESKITNMYNSHRRYRDVKEMEVRLLKRVVMEQ